MFLNVKVMCGFFATCVRWRNKSFYFSTFLTNVPTSSRPAWSTWAVVARDSVIVLLVVNFHEFMIELLKEFEELNNRSIGNLYGVYMET